MHVCFGPTESYRQSHNNLSTILQARFQLSTNSPETKTEFVMLPSLSGKNSKQYFVLGSFLTHHPELIIQN